MVQVIVAPAVPLAVSVVVGQVGWVVDVAGAVKVSARETLVSVTLPVLATAKE